MQETADINEQYSVATNSANLRMEADRRSSADILVAAGWAPSRLGSALLRLHSEFDSVQHPIKPSIAAIEAIAKSMDPKMQLSERLEAAKATAAEWHAHEIGLMLGRLKSLPAVREQLVIQSDKWGMDNPRHVAASVIQWWLSRQCTSCHGIKFQVIEGTARLSGKLCKTCRGTGETGIPCGEAGKRIAIYIDDCLHRARNQIKNRLHSTRNPA